MPKEFYEGVYVILMAVGASPSMQADFVRYFTEDAGSAIHREWRFQGKLGFGGKFWRRPSGHDVNCYTEDLTSERKKLIKYANDLIKALEARFEGINAGA